MKLKYAAEIIMGQSPKSDTYNENGDGLPFFQGKSDFGDLNPTERIYCSNPLKIAKEKDLLISVRAPVGDLNIANQECCIGRGLAAIRSKEGVSNHKYLYYCILNKKELLQSKSTGSTFKAISKSILEELDIELPNIDIQERIVQVLDKSKDIIRQRKQQIEILEKLSISIFYEMFGDIRINPKGFNVCKLEDLVKDKGDIVDGPFGSSVNTKTDYIENGEIPVIRTKNVKMMEFCEDDLKFMRREKYETVKRSQVIPGDIIITKVGTIGNVCIFPNIYKEAVLSTTGSCRVRVNEKIVNKAYLLMYLALYKPIMLDMASAGVQAFLNMNHIKNFNIVLPDMELQNKFEEIVNKIEKEKELLKQSLEQLETNFKALEQKAFNGELFN